MAIEQFHFDGGVELNAFLPSRRQLQTIMDTRRGRGEILLPGEYDMTPAPEHRPHYEHHIIVFDSGTGLYRAGEQIIPIERDSFPAAVMTRNPGSGSLQIHDIVRFTRK
jgi:hypothetical protein